MQSYLSYKYITHNDGTVRNTLFPFARILHGSMNISHQSLLTELREARANKASLSKVLDARKLTEHVWYETVVHYNIPFLHPSKQLGCPKIVLVMCVYI